YQPAAIRELGAGGATLVLAQALVRGDRLEVELRAPGGAVVRALGARVVAVTRDAASPGGAWCVARCAFLEPLRLAEVRALGGAAWRLTGRRALFARRSLRTVLRRPVEAGNPQGNL